MATFIRERPVSETSAVSCLVEHNGEYFVVSSVIVPGGVLETLVFPADSDGNVISWLEVAGGRGMSREEAIADLEANND